LVDLPGYGWARTSKKNKADWKKMIDNYLRNRKNLFSVFVLIDSRHEPQQIDLEFINWLGEEAVPFCLVFTKADKLGKTQIQRNISIYNKTLKKTWEELPQMFITSSEEKVGRKEILEFIESINQSTQQ
jgi:GTP-binding protein